MSPEQEFDALWQQIERNTLNRSKGSWTRAVKYGGKSATAGAVSTLQSQAWGLRSGAPSGLAGGALAGLAGGPIGLPFAISTVAGFLIGSAIEEGLKRIDPKIGEKVWGAAKDGVKKDWPEYQKNAVQVIDRNIQKLNAAVTDKNQKIRALQGAANLSAAEKDARLHDALRAWAEVRYYRYKVQVLLENLSHATQKLAEEVEKLDDPMEKEFGALKKSAIGLLTPAGDVPGVKGPALPEPPGRPRMNAVDLNRRSR